MVPEPSARSAAGEKGDAASLQECWFAPDWRDGASPPRASRPLSGEKTSAPVPSIGLAQKKELAPQKVVPS